MPDLTGDEEAPRAAKIALRGQLITARRALTVRDRSRAASQLQGQILDFVRREHPSTIAAYVPIGPEPGGADLPAVLAAHARVLLPVLLPSRDLDWAEFSGSLAPGPLGLLEPPGLRLGVSAVASADLVLVPALAVSRAGIRMGRGGGSYDRALARLPRSAPPLVLALLHDGELLDAVPAEPHDRVVHGVITPSGGLRLSRAV
ncbi:5-formyltetrahydrofolate cyclo-ligase [Paractinoplanes rhizophilus]|jgi:5-formyltetrahydrofolate cyclo-ligase|uniref:5-formyltetrahydrofolate cyclo-ligase n=1 Tax=Paractinoplanes rhizophilus TaxID=1416877 RepID=A0ABW2HRC0_9ACTN|nr:5-formyltetrahydrofolate cyclo-ligase [Actinoplanes sp.]